MVEFVEVMVITTGKIELETVVSAMFLFRNEDSLESGSDTV